MRQTVASNSYFSPVAYALGSLAFIVEHRVLDLIGLTLNDARATWNEQGVRDEDIRIVETAPPTRPPRRENAPPKRKNKTLAKPPKAAPQFGALRVLRVVESEQKIEVTVAREELKCEL